MVVAIIALLIITFSAIVMFILSMLIATWAAPCIQLIHSNIAYVSDSDHGRSTICTKYMARELNSKFTTLLPQFKQKQVWAISWGLVLGRTQIYYCPYWSKQWDPVPQTWFYDVFHQNGTTKRNNSYICNKEITCFWNSTFVQRIIIVVFVLVKHFLLKMLLLIYTFTFLYIEQVELLI
jgi:hypothetical protein